MTLNPNIREFSFRTVDDSGENPVWVPMTPQERKFALECQRIIDEGRVPGPTELNLVMGRGRDNNLHGRFSVIRRAVFLGAGLRKNVARDRWELPTHT